MKISVFWDVMMCRMLQACKTTQLHIPEDSNLHIHQPQNLKSGISYWNMYGFNSFIYNST
jgi:hypothetical protein